jgi:CheY-like chemotaxis protein
MKRILAIDDDPINRQLLEIYLKGSFTYKIVNNARQAIDSLKGETFDAVVTDVNLEGDEDGVWLGKYIKSIPQLDHVPVVAFTAHMASHITKENASEAFDHIIVKPVLKNQFITQINEILLQEHPSTIH